MKKFITIVILLSVLGGAVYGWVRWRAQSQQSKLVDFQTMTAELGNLTETIGATGEVHSLQSAILDWKTSGTVELVNFSAGDHVQAGDKLAQLASTSLPQNIILAQADLESAQKALEDLYTNAENSRVQALLSISTNARSVKDAQYQLDNFTVGNEQAALDPISAYDLMKEKLDMARLAFEPYKFYPSNDPTREDLKDKLDASQADFNVAVKRLEYEYALQVANANLEKARQDYERWKDGPRSEEVAAAQARIEAAQATIKLAWIEAPFEATITNADPAPGDQVTPNTRAFRLDDMSALLVDLAVSEIDINEIQVGQQALVTFDAIRSREYRGSIVSVDQVGTSNQGVVDFQVTIQLEDPDERVKPGMTAAVNIVIDQLENVLLVPNRAVRFIEGRPVVYILKEDQVIPVNIELGASSESDSEVLEGDLNVGDLIILNPPTQYESNGPPPFVRGGGS